MKPKSLSASAIKVANLCLSRYYAENIVRGRAPSSTFANLGTAVHGALELYVKTVYLEKKDKPSIKLLLDLFQLSYIDTFHTTVTSGQDWDDGVEMLKAWFKRTDFSSFEVISCEIKENFPIKTSIGPIPFNFIWDRHDRLEDGLVRVVDYKTNRWGYTPTELKELPQARCYGLAANIKYPDAERIWVEFDMLRHDGPVGVAFTPEDNRATYRWLKSEAERIIEAPDTKIPETVNKECLFCVRKTTCNAFKRHVSAGGVMSYSDPSEAIDRRAQLEYAKKMVSSALAELDEFIMTSSKETDIFEWESDSNIMEIGFTRSTRTVDEDRAAMVIGEELMDEYGGRRLTMASVDKLLKGDELSDQQKKNLRSLISSKQGKPQVKVRPKSQFEDD